MGEDVVERILKDQRLLNTIVSAVEERVRADLIVSKVDELQRAVNSLVKAVQDNSDQIKLVWERLEENDKAILELQREEARHSEAIQGLQRAVEEHSKVLEEHSKVIQQHSEAIQGLQRAVEEHSKVIERHSKVIEELVFSFKQLKVSIDSFTSRAGIHAQKTIMELYREALKLHGVDPSNVKHGVVEDIAGVIEKGRKYEVDFYETDDYVYVFEVKNLADEGAIEQLLIRRKVLGSQTPKEVKLFLVSNSIEEAIRRQARKEGITVIAGHVIRTRR
ncbi:hypothetical protein HS1genome_1906 [Sulfodiicoccus acidiphilus]|uniref:Microtubule-binding protein n=1 Tax=Sulfodiicoccus acidiphilus TaxID=1670455 RepID=A0A348B5R5_9CREN|nr:hypothetical protein [Sulfodiicoccus acidiphilus]BBD73517.1 hypothetical protein HS1genome_1906 [Sulfodiicoccus acidiphilus]GGT92583.1 hypothetical protein GCM10007116_07930 [Sulfodiicoccus acidiphilus]